MVMKKYLFNMVVSVLCICGTAQADDTLPPIDFKGIYDFSFASLPFGRMGIEADQSEKHYAITCDVISTGIIGAFVRHSSHTTVDGTGAHFSYPTIHYETNYKTKKKRKYVRMATKGGKIVEEELVPPDNRQVRPAVEDALKNSAADPLSFLLKMRQGLWDARKTGATAFSVNLYDGRRLTQVNFAVMGKKSIFYKDAKTDVIQVNASRKLVAGFTPSELEAFNPKEPTLRIFFTDDNRLVPLILEANVMMSKLSATLVKECRTGESCLLGNKE